MRLSTSSSLPPTIFKHPTATTLLLLLVSIATVVLAPTARASTIPLGTITVADPSPCPTIFYSGMTCRGATIDCSNVDSHTDTISVTIGYVTQATTPTGLSFSSPAVQEQQATLALPMGSPTPTLGVT